MSRIRAEIVFHGHVQGVGFRWTAVRVAEGLDIDGWVRNEPDGTVRLLAEGLQEDVVHLVQGIDEALPGHVKDREYTISAASGEFSGFRIFRAESHR